MTYIHGSDVTTWPKSNLFQKEPKDAVNQVADVVQHRHEAIRDSDTLLAHTNDATAQIRNGRLSHPSPKPIRWPVNLGWCIQFYAPYLKRNTDKLGSGWTTVSHPHPFTNGGILGYYAVWKKTSVREDSAVVFLWRENRFITVCTLRELCLATETSFVSKSPQRPSLAERRRRGDCQTTLAHWLV